MRRTAARAAAVHEFDGLQHIDDAGPVMGSAKLAGGGIDRRAELFREPRRRLDLEGAVRRHAGEQTGTADSRSALPLTAEEGQV